MPSRNFVCCVCKLIKQRCSRDCVFAPHFPSDQPSKFINVQKLFTKLMVENILKSLDISQRGDAASAISYEADARVLEPVYGCVGYIPILVQEIQEAQINLDNTKKQFAEAKAMISDLSQEIMEALINLLYTRKQLAIVMAGGVLAHCPPLFHKAQKQQMPSSVDASGFNQISAAAMLPYQIQEHSKRQHEHLLDRLREIMGPSGMQRMLQCHLRYIQWGYQIHHLVQPEFQHPPVQPQQQRSEELPEFQEPQVHQQQRLQEPRDATIPSSTGLS